MVHSEKKNGPLTLCIRAHQTFTLGLSHSFSKTYGFSNPQMRTLCLFIFLEVWKVTSSEKLTGVSQSYSSSIRCNISVAKAARREWSSGYKAWTSCTLYAQSSEVCEVRVRQDESISPDCVEKQHAQRTVSSLTLDLFTITKIASLLILCISTSDASDIWRMSSVLTSEVSLNCKWRFRFMKPKDTGHSPSYSPLILTIAVLPRSSTSCATVQ
jgi:hypothetical protein